MGRKKESGFLETLVKSVLGSGKTVHHSQSFFGNKKTVIKNHRSGNKKQVTYGTGFFGNTSSIKKTNGFRTLETGTVEGHFFSSGRTERTVKPDGTRIKRVITPGFFKNSVKTTVQGACSLCLGLGRNQYNCRQCNGTKTFPSRLKDCIDCKGFGLIGNRTCSKCAGKGTYSVQLPCLVCDENGMYDILCKRCDGSGSFIAIYKD